MPHIVIEHSINAREDFDLKGLSKSIHHKLALQESVSISAIKTRTCLVENIFIGNDLENDKFIHVTISLLVGRSLSLKETMAQNIYDAAQSFVALKDYTITVEVRDLDVYYKG